MNIASFDCGDMVEWESQAGGHSKKKVGKVIDILVPGDMPRHEINGGTGFARKQMSYVVSVEFRPGRFRNYWPIASKLRAIKAVQNAA